MVQLKAEKAAQEAEERLKQHQEMVKKKLEAKRKQEEAARQERARQIRNVRFTSRFSKRTCICS
eukprot:m.110779 g.110779  ORF g.110779 m.110779 type:complete len:64 (+) comp22736_c0_seq7:1182-1373(+)